MKKSILAIAVALLTLGACSTQGGENQQETATDGIDNGKAVPYDSFEEVLRQEGGSLPVDEWLS